MNTNKREYCVLCDCSHLISFSSFEHPIYECVPIDSTNLSWNIEFGYCENCYSTQLMSLADPALIYGKNYFQPLNTSWLWVQHNISFVKFIIDNLNINMPLIEIGSSSFCLGKHLIEYYNDYTVFDISIEQAIKRKYVKYIEGNCETYDFRQLNHSNTNIVMSHVFEHLYDPKKFIKNCYENNVKNILISIPSMDEVNSLHISYQHTFTYNEQDIEYIFGLFNYKLNDKLIWNTKSNDFPCLFFHFVINQDKITIEKPIMNNRHLFTINLLRQKINVPKNTFISTCGMWSIIIYNLIENKENIIGVIDLNKEKQGKKFSTTNILIYGYEHIENSAVDINTSILIHHPKKNNIIKMIRSINENINIITI